MRPAGERARRLNRAPPPAARVSGAAEARRAAEARWHEALARHGRTFSGDSLSGASPPSVFVGSHGYPYLGAGPMLPPAHGDTGLMDAPERWAGMGLGQVVGLRLGLVRGVRRVRADRPGGRYVEALQELAMAGRPADSEVEFEGAARPPPPPDGSSPPFGPVGEVRSARFSSAAPDRRIESAYYDRDLAAADAVVGLYGSGVEVSRIQRCLSAGMLGRRRRLVPTRWAITAADDAISGSLVRGLLDAPVIDSHRVFTYSHMGNVFSVVLFPHRWLFEVVEAWQSGGAPAFGSDREGARGMRRQPSIAGAYFAARLGVAEYLAAAGVQAGALVLREIRPEYSVPVGVWQVREGVRAAMRGGHAVAGGLWEAIEAAAGPTSVSAREWAAAGSTVREARQASLPDFF